MDADNVDYGDDNDQAMNVDDDDIQDNKNGWADDVDYGDDDDEDHAMLDDDEDGIGDLDLSDVDDDDLPPDDAMGAPQQQFKSEITSTLDNPNRIGVSYKLEFDARQTPGDISDDDETAPGLRINHFQLCTASQAGVIHAQNGNPVETMLGSGSFAKVFRARNTRNGKIVALKCMYKNLLRKQFLMKSRYNLEADDDTPNLIRHTMLDAVQIELQIMMKIRQINLIRLYYIIDDPTKESLYLAIEYSPYGQVMDFDGSLLQYIPNTVISPKENYIISNKNVAQEWWYLKYVVKDKDDAKTNALREKVDRFNEDCGRKLFMDCVKGVQCLHDMNIIHRDLKPENLLLFEDTLHESGLMIKIADYGTAEQFQSKDEAILIDTQGTYHFMSPSAIGGDKRNAFYDDIWALGIVLYSFIFGTVPFFHPLDYQLFESIQNDALILPENDVLSASDEVRDLITKLLVKKDEERITLAEIEKHQWFSEYVHPTGYIIEADEPEYEPNDNCCVVL